MGKYIVFCHINGREYQRDADDLINNSAENYLSNTVLPIENKKILFPVEYHDSKLYVTGEFTGWKILLQGQEVSGESELSHGSYVIFSSEEISYSMLFIDTARRTLAANCAKISSGSNIFIGRSPESNIVIDINGSVSRKHAAVRIAANKAHIEDLSRSTGVFLNGKRVSSAELRHGDVISIMGCSICYMTDYLIIPKNVQINNMEQVRSFDVVQPVARQCERAYIRTPRILKSLDKQTIEIDPPTQPQKSKQVPFLLVAGPSATMAFGMLASFGVALNNAMNGGNLSSTITSGVMVVSMLLGSIMWPSLLRNYNKRREEADEKYRVDKYRHYLMQKDAEIRKSYDRNSRIWNENLLPSVETLSQHILKRSLNLWERTNTDEDFLRVRLSVGARPFEVKIQCPKKGFSLYDDEMIDESVSLAQKYMNMHSVPIGVSLLENRTLGLVGYKENVFNTISCIILNICALHSPEDVKICVICSELQQERIAWIKNMPHCWNMSRTMRYFASDYAGAYRLLTELDEKIQEREEVLRKEDIRTPHIVFFILDTAMVENVPFYRYLTDADNNVGVSAIFAAEQFDSIPKECTAIIQNEDDICGIYEKNKHDNKFIPFKADVLAVNKAQQISQSMSEIPVKTEKGQLGIPERVSFLDMYKVGTVDKLAIEQKWANNMSDKTLAVPIGVKAGGELFYLDIHEKYHGCHGLVASMTGSRKSEFLQAFILSALINYSPNEIAFVLVDFKGGDMARPFLKIPHLSATISNLSGNTLYRALISLEAEVKARQRIFNSASAKLGIDKIDINSYHKYFKEHRLTLPLPHLVIVIDEFAQLKSQQPEFMSKLIEIAQVGRSLGIHLILATQKPTGVVDPQIWSNSRFKVCLKVLDKQDSAEMINRIDAALIKQPGRAYVQVGYDEIFEQIQSGYSGANYIPQERFVNDEEITVTMTDSAALPLRTARYSSAGLQTGRTQLEEAVNKIIQTAQKLHLKAKPLWLEPLSDTIYLNQCMEFNAADIGGGWDSDYNVTATLGMIDLIETQKQIPLTLSLPQSGHIAVYGAAGTGKTTLVQTIVFSLALRYSPEMLNIFAFDFGGRNLGILSELPHCVNTAFADEEEKVQYMFNQILDCIEYRKVLFSQNNCATYEAYIETTGKKLPAVLVILDNYAAFRDRMFQCEDDMVRIASNAKAYGIYLLITGNSKNAIYYKVAEHISNMVVLRMNDKLHYRDILNIPVPIEPEACKGRGITVYNKTAVEFQAALPVEAGNEADRNNELLQIYKKAAAAYKGESPINQYGAGVYEKAVSENTAAAAPAPASKPKPEPQRAALQTLPPIKDDGHSIVFGTALLSGQLQGFKLRDTENIFIEADGAGADVLFERVLNLPNSTVYNICSQHTDDIAVNASSEADIHAMVEELISESNDRYNELQMLKASNFDDDVIYECMQKYERIILWIRSFSQFYDTISDDDLSILLSILKRQEQSGIYAITTAELEKIEPYCDTALYIELIKTTKGAIVGTNISDKMTARLCKEFSDIPIKERKRQLKDNQALLFNAGACSIIDIS